MTEELNEKPMLRPRLNSFTILPRMAFCTDLLDSILEELKSRSKLIKTENSRLYRTDSLQEESVDMERALYFAQESLAQIRYHLQSVTGVWNIPFVLSASVPLIRATNSKLHGLVPEIDSKLAKLSSVIGSIIVDSASISEAQVNFKEINSESGKLLDVAKLMADSKINKLYPNLDLLKESHA